MDQFDNRNLSFGDKHVPKVDRCRLALQMFSFYDQFWSRWLNLSDAFHSNRSRASGYLRAAYKAGFININCEIVSKEGGSLNAILPRFGRSLRSVPEKVLAILFISFHCQKPLNF
jgi:hypothetical protein